MDSSPAISALESAAADLGKLLSGWTRDRLAEAEAAHADPADPEARAKRPDLATINSGIQSLWRLVSVQKSIQQLKNPPVEHVAQPPSAVINNRQSTHVAQPPSAVILGSSNVAPMPSAVIPNDKPSTDVAPAPSPAIHASPFTLPSSVPFVPSIPSVPSVPALHSLQAIVAKTKKLYAETASLMSASGLPVLTSAPTTPDPVPTNLLDIITGRPNFPGSGKLIESLRSQLKTSPP